MLSHLILIYYNYCFIMIIINTFFIIFLIFWLFKAKSYISVTSDAWILFKRQNNPLSKTLPPFLKLMQNKLESIRFNHISNMLVWSHSQLLSFKRPFNWNFGASSLFFGCLLKTKNVDRLFLKILSRGFLIYWGYKLGIHFVDKFTTLCLWKHFLLIKK